MNVVQYQAHYEASITVRSEAGITFCFSSLDTLNKEVSFDIFKEDDSMRDKITEKDFAELYEELDKTYRAIAKLYRDQHFYLERNKVHRDKLENV